MKTTLLITHLAIFLVLAAAGVRDVVAVERETEFASFFSAAAPPQNKKVVTTHNVKRRRRLRSLEAIEKSEEPDRLQEDSSAHYVDSSRGNSSNSSNSNSSNSNSSNSNSSNSTSNSLFDVTTIEHAPPPPANTDRKTVLVTGAAGFVGSHVSEFLLARGDRVIVLDEVNNYYNVSIKESNLKLLQDKGGSQVVIYRGDICNSTLVQHIFETEKPTWVVHLAARAGVRPSILDPFVYIHSNIQGTTRLLEMSIQYKVVNFVMASSSSVYGGSKSTLFDEHENVDFPISPYAASKRVTELLGTYYHSRFGLSITALRFFTVYGPRGRPDMAPFKFIDWTARGKPIQQYGNGSSSRDYTYIDDIVAGVVGALDRPAPIYQNVNLGKGSGTSLSQFVELVAKYVGKQPEIQVLPDQPGDVPYTCANVTRAHAMLNYTPTIPFEAGIAKTVEWYKEVYPYSLANENDGKELVGGNDYGHKEKNRKSKDHNEERHRRRRRLQAATPNQETKKVLVVAQQDSTLLTQQVVNTLTKRGDSVALIVPTASMHHALQPQEYEFVQMNSVAVHHGCVDNATFLELVLEQEKPKWVCYLNSLSSAAASQQDPYTYIDVNIQAFVRLLEAVKKEDIMNFVFTSSSQVYERTAVWHSEKETIPRFDSPYAVTQKARELFAHTWHSLYRIPMTALRIPQIYGPGKHWFGGGQDGTENPGLASSTKEDGEMEQVQEFMYVDDAVDGILRALDRPYPYQILNLGQGPDLVEEACQSQSSLKEMLLSHLQGRFFATSVIRPCALVTVDKAHARLGFTAQIRLREGIRRIATWFWDHPGLLPTSSSELVFVKPSDLGNEQYPPLPWGMNTEKIAVGPSDGAESNAYRLPIGVEELAQLQWLVVALFLVWKFMSWGRKRNT
ncbi:hypothetical protein ACA910_021511 [Epithemia clementina (nom. ined.)]